MLLLASQIYSTISCIYFNKKSFYRKTDLRNYNCIIAVAIILIIVVVYDSLYLYQFYLKHRLLNHYIFLQNAKIYNKSYVIKIAYIYLLFDSSKN